MGQKGKRSEFWQRLRAARAKARKTQSDVAKAMGLSRPAITLWEAKEREKRTAPSVEQMAELAAILGVPMEFLIDDTADTDQVWEFAGIKPRPTPSPLEQERQGRDEATVVASAFWAAVRYQMLMQEPDVANAFDVLIRTCGVQARVSYIRNKAMATATFVRDNEDLQEVLRRETAALLWAEKASGRHYSKHLMLWTRDPGELSAFDVDCIEKTFGVSVRTFNDVNTAANHTLALT